MHTAAGNLNAMRERDWRNALLRGIALAGALVGCQALLDLDPDGNSRPSDTAPPAATDAGASDAPIAVDAGAGPAGSVCPPPRDGGLACPAQARGWNGRCYFVAGNADTDRFGAGQGRCEAVHKDAYIATITCEDEWLEARITPGMGAQNTYLGASRVDAGAWHWGTLERYAYEPNPPLYGYDNLMVERNLSWLSTPPTSTAFFLCEVGPYAP
jgi:hypothetical protein